MGHEILFQCGQNLCGRLSGHRGDVLNGWFKVVVANKDQKGLK